MTTLEDLRGVQDDVMICIIGLEDAQEEERWMHDEHVNHYLAPGGCYEVFFFSPGLSVCVSVCLCVCVSCRYLGILFIGY